MDERETLLSRLTDRDAATACGCARRIAGESRESAVWYPYLKRFAALLRHKNSLVRNRALGILAANARWDTHGRYAALLDELLTHVTDEKPITARQCVKALRQVGQAKPRYIPRILSALRGADLSKYKDSMRPLLEKDIAQTQRLLESIPRD